MTAGTMFAWHHIRCRVPSDWEVTAYSIEPRRGRAEFNTRRGLQAVYSWEPCRREPDPRTTMVSFLEKNVPRTGRGETKPGVDFAVASVGAFAVGYSPSGGPAQALMWNGKARTLLRWVFPFFDSASPSAVWRKVLESIEPNDSESRHYTFFGLNLRLPDDFSIETTTALPADTSIIFESSRKQRLTFRRWGLSEQLLDGNSLEVFYPRILESSGCRITEVAPATFRNHPALRVQFQRRGEYQSDVFLGRLWKNGNAICWHNVTEKRIYAFEQVGPGKVPPLDEEDVLREPGTAEHFIAPAFAAAPVDDSAFSRQLLAVPVRNSRMTVLTEDPKTTIVSVDLQYPGWIRPLRRVFNLRDRKQYRIDGVGLEVFNLVDGVRTFEQIIDVFTSTHKLTFLEGRGLLSAYLRDLTRRGLIAVAVSDS